MLVDQVKCERIMRTEKHVSHMNGHVRVRNDRNSLHSATPHPQMCGCYAAPFKRIYVDTKLPIG